MNQTDLIRAISKRSFLTQVESREIIKFILSRITEDLKKGQRVYFRGFGSFTKEKRSSKKVRHPKTGKIITIPERTTVDFDPAFTRSKTSTSFLNFGGIGTRKSISLVRIKVDTPTAYHDKVF